MCTHINKQEDVLRLGVYYTSSVHKRRKENDVYVFVTILKTFYYIFFLNKQHNFSNYTLVGVSIFKAEISGYSERKGKQPMNGARFISSSEIIMFKDE